MVFDHVLFEKVVFQIQGKRTSWVAEVCKKGNKTVRSWARGKSQPDRAVIELLCSKLEGNPDPNQFWKDTEQDAA